MRVLFLSESLNVGGAEKALVTILKNLDYSKMDVTLMLISKSGGFVKELDLIKGLQIKYIIEPTNSRFTSILNSIKTKTIYKWLSPSFVGNWLCKGYDVVIAFCEGYLTKWVGASSNKCKKIAWVHTDMVNNDWPLKTGVFKNEEVERKTYHKFDNVVSVSKIVARGMKEKFGCKNNKVVYNIIDSEIRRKSQEFIPQIAKSQLNIVSVGRLEYVKGYDLLIRAVEILVKKKHFDIHLTLVGDGSQKSQLIKIIDEANLENNISLMGLQPNPYPFVSISDLFVCPSRQEGFNIAILEAMSLGTPVLATNTAGPSEILEDGKYGILTEVSVYGLVSSIERFYNDQQLISEYAFNSLKRIQDFTLDTSIKEIERMILK